MPENFDFKSLGLPKEPDPTDAKAMAGKQKKFDEEFGKLPEEEREEVIGAAREEAADIDAKAKEQKEIILTSEQEKVKERLIKCLSNNDIDDVIKIKEKFNLSNDVF